MAEIVNLRRARKDRARAEKDAVAAQNRARFGRTKAERDAEALKSERAVRVLEGHKRDDQPS